MPTNHREALGIWPAAAKRPGHMPGPRIAQDSTEIEMKPQQIYIILVDLKVISSAT